MNDYLSEARARADEIAALRHALHREPELGNKEWRTARRVESVLNDLGIETRRLLGTAVVGVLRGAMPGPTAALRADMDALPLQEATGAEFASRNAGVMHACGHDVHMAAALGCAMLLAARRESLRGSVIFLFQPDEEGSGGAQRMIAAGVLEGVDAVFGAHVSPDLPAGHIGVRCGKFYAASNTFRAVVRGRSCHGAEREKGADALAAAARMVLDLNGLPALFPNERSVVSVGTLYAGTADNIVADRAEFAGIARTLGPDTRAAMVRYIRETVADVSAAEGVETELHLHESYPGVVNHDAETGLVQAAAEALLGPDRVHVLSVPTMTTEDFGYFLQERPGSFYHIGAGCPLPLHNPAFLPADDAAVTAAAVHAAVLTRYLENENNTI